MNIRKTFESFAGTGLQQESFPEDMSWDAYMEEYQKYTSKDPELKELLKIKQQEDLVNSVTLENIMASNFQTAKEVIEQMTIAKRIAILEDLSKYRDQLYDSFSRYGDPGVPRDEQLSPGDFRALIGRVKHLEILQNWLYGIM